MKEPLFSLIIPAYNAEDFLAECFDSILRQTCDNYEVILIDDGSTDSTFTIAREYKNLFGERLIVKNQDNKGAYVARAYGYSLAQGEYVLSVDADDFLRRDALEVIAGEIERSAPDIVAYEISHDPLFRSMKKMFPYNTARYVTGISGRIELINLSLNTYAFNCLSTKAIKSELLKNVTYSEESRSLSFAEDFLLSMFVLDQAQSFVYLPYALYYYRQHEASITHQSLSKNIDDARIVHDLFSDLLEKWQHECSFKISRGALEARSLRTFFQYCNVTFSHQPYEQAIHEVRRVTEGEWFRNSWSIPQARLKLRFDRRICLTFIAWKKYRLAWCVFGLRRFCINLMRDGMMLASQILAVVLRRRSYGTN